MQGSKTHYRLDKQVRGNVQTATSLTNASFVKWDPGVLDPSENLAAPGDGQEYFASKLLISADVAVTVTLKGDSAIVYGPHRHPLGLGQIEFPGRGLAFGANKAPKITVAAIGQENAAANVDLFATVGPQ